MGAALGQSLGALLGQFATGGNTSASAQKGMLDGAQAGAYDATRQRGLAEALKAEAETIALRRRNELQMPEAIQRSGAMQYGVPEIDLPALAEFQRTGQLNGGRYAAPADGVGPTMDKPAWAANLPALGRTTALTEQALRLGDNSIKNLADAESSYQDVGLVNQAAALAKTGDDMGMSRINTIRGKKEFTPFKAVGTTGTTLNEVVGTQKVSDVGMNNLFTQGERATIGQRTAAAGASNASAGKYLAETDKVNQETTNGRRQYDSDRGGLVNLQTGEFTPISQGGQPVAGKGGGKPLNDSQGKANLFGTRMKEANTILSGLEDGGVKNGGLIRGALQGAVGLTPFVGDKLSDAAGSVMNVMPGIVGGPSEGQQQFEQAQRNFLNAVLRRESGAVIGPSEFASGQKQYFPQPGDSPKVLAQKRANRESAIRGIEAEVPGGFRDGPTTPAVKGRAAEGKVVDFGSLQ